MKLSEDFDIGFVVLWFSLLILSEKAKAVIRKICSVYLQFVCVWLWLHTIVLGKIWKLRLHCSLFILQRHYRHILRKINSSRHSIIVSLLKSGITMLTLNIDDLKFVTELPCLLGYPVKSVRTPMFIGIPCKISEKLWFTALLSLRNNFFCY